MTRVTRSRSKQLPYPAGHYDYYRNGTTGHNTNSGKMFYQDMDDSHGRPVVASPLFSRIFERSGLPVLNGSSGIVGGPGNWMELVNYVPGTLQGWAPGHKSFSNMPSAADSMATLIARTNPSRPMLTPFTLMQDIYEIPRQLRDVGKLLKKSRKSMNAKDLANANLATQFGWIPLINDALTLMHLGKYINQRLNELSRLYSANGLKRRIHLGNWAGDRTNTATVMSAYLICVATDRNFTKAERWGTVRWKPVYDDLPSSGPSHAATLDEAINVLLGLTPEGLRQGLWDVIPWTWIVDWFSNVGDHVVQHSNSIPAVPSEACIMTRTVTKSQITTTQSDSNIKSSGPGSMTYTTLERYVGSGTINAHLPYLSVRRLSVLGSLFIQRFTR